MVNKLKHYECIITIWLYIVHRSVPWNNSIPPKYHSLPHLLSYLCRPACWSYLGRSREWSGPGSSLRPPFSFVDRILQAGCFHWILHPTQSYLGSWKKASNHHFKTLPDLIFLKPINYYFLIIKDKFASLK